MTIWTMWTIFSNFQLSRMGTFPSYNRRWHSILGGIYVMLGCLLTDIIIIVFTATFETNKSILLLIKSTCGTVMITMNCSCIFMTYLLLVFASSNRYRAINEHLRFALLNRSIQIQCLKIVLSVAGICLKLPIRMVDARKIH